LCLELLESRIAPAIFNVPSGGTLLAAINTADSNSDSSNLINVAPGSYQVINPLIQANSSKTLVIDGTGPGVILTANQQGRIFEINANVGFVNLSIEGGKAVDSGMLGGNAALGGGLLIDGGTAVLSNVNLSGNQAVGAAGGAGAKGVPGGRGADAWGGGIYLAQGTLIIKHSTISNNAAIGGNGGTGGKGTSGANGSSGAAGAVGAAGSQGPAAGSNGRGGPGGPGGGGHTGGNGGPGANGAAGQKGGDGGNAGGGGIYVAGGQLIIKLTSLQGNTARGGKGGPGGNGGPGGVGGHGGTGGQGGVGGRGGHGPVGTSHYRTYSKTQTHTKTHTRTYTQTHTRTYTDTYTRTHTHTQTCHTSHTTGGGTKQVCQTHTHTNTHTHSHPHSHTNTHTHTHSHTHTHTHTHTNTHTRTYYGGTGGPGGTGGVGGRGGNAGPGGAGGGGGTGGAGGTGSGGGIYLSSGSVLLAADSLTNQAAGGTGGTGGPGGNGGLGGTGGAGGQAGSGDSGGPGAFYGPAGPNGIGGNGGPGGQGGNAGAGGLGGDGGLGLGGDVFVSQGFSISVSSDTTFAGVASPGQAGTGGQAGAPGNGGSGGPGTDGGLAGQAGAMGGTNVSGGTGNPGTAAGNTIDPATAQTGFSSAQLQAPAATLNAVSLTNANASSETPYTFEVTFQDPNLVDAGSLAASTVQVQPPSVSAITAQLVGTTPSGTFDALNDGTTLVATYQIAPPGSNWSTSPQGNFSVTLGGSPVTDLDNNSAPTGALGSFSVSVSLLATDTAVSASPGASSVYGQSVAFTATVTPAGPGSGTPTGTIQFQVDGSNFGAPVSLAGDITSLSTTVLAAGSHTIAAIYSGDTIFAGSSSTLSGGQTVTPAPLTITAQNQVMDQGSNVPTLTASFSGFVNGDSPASLTTQPTPTTTATSASPVGSYPITVSGAVGPNYSISYQNGTLTVLPAGSALISGTVFQNINVNGVQNAGEPGIAGVTAFIDLSGSGVLQPGDPTAITDSHGNFQINVRSAGTYTLRELLYGGVLVDAPAGGSYRVTVTAGSNVTGQDFADVPTSIALPLVLPLTSLFPKQGNPDADFIEAVYRAVLARNADPAGLAYWTGLLQSGRLSRLGVVQGIRNSAENFTQEVTDFYFTILSRAPDPGGLQAWVRELENGVPEEQVAAGFLDSPEYLSKGDRYFVDHMYEALLGRTFDAAGEAAWLYELGDNATGTRIHPPLLSYEQVVTDFLHSPESLKRLVEGYYQIFLRRLAEPTGLDAWLAALQQGASFSTIANGFLTSDEFFHNAAAQG
jgi:hypothetical protein